MALVIGVDGGTEGLRAGVYRCSDGAELGYASAPYPTHFPHPSWAEQAPEDWWTALGAAVRGALSAAAAAHGGDPAASVAALCVDTTCCSVVALDAAGKPLRPCLLWMDVRSAEQAAQLAACSDGALCVNGGGGADAKVSAEWMIPKAMWLKQRERATYDAAAMICEYQEYVNLRLTGRYVASTCNAAVRWHWRGGREQPLSMLTAVGMDDLAAKWPQEALPPGALVGGLTPEAAEHLGLRAGLAVAQGGADAFIGVLGLGVLHAGELALLTGSSHLHLGVCQQPQHGPGVWGAYEGALPFPGGGCILEGGQTSTGSVAAWCRRLFSGPDGPLVSYAQLDAEAAAVPLGCEGLLCLDHFQGNRTPHTDPLSRGAFAGLTLRHTRGHMFRAALEGVAFGTRAVLEAMRARGYQPTRITIAGGAARSALWARITADVVGIPLVLTRNGEAPALGCAVLAAVAAGAYADVEAACAAMVHAERVITPDAKAHAAYARFYEAYASLYPALAPVVRAAGAAAAELDGTC